MVFAATKPERTAGLILANTAARFLWADDHPFGTPREVADQLIEQVAELWGTEALVWIAVPSRAADERYRRWHARLQRAMASPSAVQAYLRALFDSGSASVQGRSRFATTTSGGLTVHIAARVMGEAGAGEALISRAVRDLLSGSDIALEDRGVHLLRASMAIGRCLLSPPCNPVAPVQACIAVSATRSAGGLHTGEVELSDGDVAGSRCCAGDDRAWVG